MRAGTLRGGVTLAFAMGVALAVACGSSDKGGGEGTSPEGGASSGDPNAPPPPPPGGFGDSGQLDVAPTGDANECAESSAAASKTTRPVDIILVIDNSLTMKDKITVVENQISTNLVNIVDAAKIDWRVIMLSAHGTDTATQAKVCIRAPLSGTNCSPIPAQPAETTRFFHHSLSVGSNDAWCIIQTGLTTTDQFGLHVGGYQSLLRAGAFKVFIVMTDDRVSATCNNKTYDDNSTGPGGTGSADSFDSTLTVQYPSLFGTKSERNYIQHAIVGVTDFDATNKMTPWPSSQPISTTKCTTAFNPGTGYQGLADETGGLRYPICNLDYSSIFSAIANSTIVGAALDCQYQIPTPPPGETLDLSTVVPQFTPSGGAPAVNFQQVANDTLCAPNKFYIDSGTIKLCPDTCNTVQSDTGGATMKILYGCDPSTLPTAH